MPRLFELVPTDTKVAHIGETVAPIATFDGGFGRLQLVPTEVGGWVLLEKDGLYWKEMAFIPDAVQEVLRGLPVASKAKNIPLSEIRFLSDAASVVSGDKLSPILTSYAALLFQLRRANEDPTADSIRIAMDSLWHALSDNEREIATKMSSAIWKLTA